MTRSPKQRRSKQQRRARRRAHRQRAGRQPEHLIVAVNGRDLFLNGPDEHSMRCLEESQAAGARGDARASLRHEMDGVVVLESVRRFVMQDLIDHGDDAPPWAYSRWCADLAFRWMLLNEDPRTDEAVRCVAALLYPESLARVSDDPTELRIFGTRLACGDKLVSDLALHEFGGLADYLDLVAEPGLLDRTDRIEEWTRGRMGAFEVAGVRGPHLVLRDLVVRAEVEVLNLGSALRGDGEALVGRLVPISSSPGLMFATRPMSVDLTTAQGVAAAIADGEHLGWLLGLSTAMDEGRLPERFHLTPFTPYTTDLPFLDPAGIDDLAGIDDDDGEAEGDVGGGEAGTRAEAPRLSGLRAAGYSEAVANAVAVLEVGLIAAEVSDHAAAVVSPNVAAALATPGAFEAAMAHCRGPEHASAWRVLAGVVPDHLVDRCLTLAHDVD